MPMTTPAAQAAWARAASIPDGPGWHQGQEQLRSWIGQQIAAAVQAGQLDPNNRGQLSEFLATVGATPEAGGGRYIYKMFMGMNPTDGWAGNAALNKYARVAANEPAPATAPAPGTLGSMAAPRLAAQTAAPTTAPQLQAPAPAPPPTFAPAPGTLGAFSQPLQTQPAAADDNNEDPLSPWGTFPITRGMRRPYGA